MIVKNNYVVLSGGPGSGKTSLLHALREKGFGIVEESGRAIIRERLEKHLSPRPSPLDFALQMFQQDIAHFHTNLESDRIIFFDRSFLDSCALLKQVLPDGFNYYQHVMDSCRFSNSVFITPPWEEIYHTDSERDQTFEEATQTFHLMQDWYASQGYRTVLLPRAGVVKRVEFVLKELKNAGALNLS